MQLLNIVETCENKEKGAERAKDFKCTFMMIKDEMQKHKIAIVPLDSKDTLSITHIIKFWILIFSIIIKFLGLQSFLFWHFMRFIKSL